MSNLDTPVRRLAGMAAAVLALLVTQPTSAQQPGGTPGATTPKSGAPIDRARILTAPNVFGVFVTYRVRAGFHHLSNAERTSAAAEVLGVVAAHATTVIVDAYLTRGLGASSDYFLRVHAYDLAAAQDFLNAYRATRFGSFSEVGENLVGVTEPLNYITREKSPELNAALFATSYAGDPPRYAIVVPIRKSAEWWNLSDAERLKEMEAHTRPTLAYLANVKRKLYHATGLGDADFVTYFETNDLAAFNNLMVGLAKVPENRFHTRWGNPTLLGTIQPLDHVVKVLAAID